MEGFTKEDLIKCFDEAKKNGSKFIAVKVQVHDFSEVIINLIENADIKLKYYLEAYDDNLRLNRNNEVRIVGFAHGILFDDIQCELVD